MKPQTGHRSRDNRQLQGSTRRSFHLQSRAHGASVHAAGDYDDGQVNQDIPERFVRNSTLSVRQDPNHAKNGDESGYKIRLNPTIRQYFDVQRAIAMDLNSEAWMRAPEIPTSDEINLADGAEIKLPPNRIGKPYKSTARYLKTHFQLLREDAVSPLRDAIDHFRKNPDMQEDQVASVYEKVRVVGVKYCQNGIAFRVKFSIARISKRILWSSSKRLISGTIVALSTTKDVFHNHCSIAIVAARPLELLDQNPPEIDLYFSRPQDIEVDPHKEFVMIEAKAGYYEAHRHTLRALQKLTKEQFPLSDYILGQSLEIDPPQYLINAPVWNLNASMSSDMGQNLSMIDILKAWPNPTDATSLDPTQWAALQQMLTKQFAVIQGPPGTGKTHVSVIALKIMLKNRSPEDPPIIVAAQTNHALDQLLEHISEFEPEYIRLGGRSTSAAVKKRALYEVRGNERIANIPGSGLFRARTLLDAAQLSLSHMLRVYNARAGPIPCELLFDLGILNEKQKDSLRNAVSDWVSADSAAMDAMQHWLHKSLIPFQAVYHEQEYGFEEAEEDLEFEQLKECEAEHGVNDEEDKELLRGFWQPIIDQWTVVEPSQTDIQNATKLLDTKNDLWSDVPEYLRGPMYWVMRQRATAAVLADFRNTAAEYSALVNEIKIGRWEKDSVYLSRAKIIGMTTTGLSKYRPLIASLEPKIILIEEAAEVIEAPVAVACMDSLEHLILVGDHLQLRGHCAVQDLEGPDYNLNVSMFERLVKMDIPFKTLLKQRRMRPEFRALIASLYPKLVDHPAVMERHPPKWGTGEIRSFFFSHKWLEGKDETFSTFNEQEAIMVAKLYRHLLYNDVPPAAITILTFYNGHRKKILKEIRNDPVSNTAYANVKTVDSYQGKESSIIILSLARNNLHGNIGFLENANRVCVALSRARDGFYIFGNADIVIKNPLWHDVVSQMTVANRLGDRFPIHCPKHDTTLYVQYPRDWDEVSPAGGCDKMCEAMMACGHQCPSVCHAYKHDTILCQEPCDRNLICAHSCIKQCFEECSCDCPDYERLKIAKLHAESSSSHIGSRFSPNKQSPSKRQEGSLLTLNFKPSHGNKKSVSESNKDTRHGERQRFAGPGRTRMVLDYDTTTPPHKAK